MVIYKNENGVKIEMTAEEELEFNSFIEKQKEKKPIANGKDLVQFLESKFVNSPLIERIGLQQALLPVKATLETSTCNPLRRADFDGVLAIVGSKIEKDQYDLLKGLAQKWAESVRFEL